jgi:hypothetical protein
MKIVATGNFSSLVCAPVSQVQGPGAGALTQLPKTYIDTPPVPKPEQIFKVQLKFFFLSNFKPSWASAHQKRQYFCRNFFVLICLLFSFLNKKMNKSYQAQQEKADIMDYLLIDPLDWVSFYWPTWALSSGYIISIRGWAQWRESAVINTSVKEKPKYNLRVPFSKHQT